MNDIAMPIRQLAYYCNNTNCQDCEIKEAIFCAERGKEPGDCGCEIPAYWEINDTTNT